MPFLRTKPFTNLPQSIKAQLMILFSAASKFTQYHHTDTFSNPDRNKHCAGYLNSSMGYPKSNSLFEFFDIVVFRNTILRKHCDHRNCHRLGYNYCCVYSFFPTVNNIEYRVSVIMTTRTTVGCAFGI